MTTIRVPEHRQGQTGTGQGGWTAQHLAAAVGEPATVAFRRPIPLETDLEIRDHESGGWVLVDPSAPNLALLEAHRWEPDCSETSAVSIEEAAHAHTQFPLTLDTHPAPRCFSCGLGSDTMAVHSGPLGDGRWATDWRVPDWAIDDNGVVAESVIWSAMDCAAGWYASLEGPHRHAVTVQLAVQLHDPLQPGMEYSLVSWAGDYEPAWERRKRGAAAALFDEAGSCIAQSRSFWVAMP